MNQLTKPWRATACKDLQSTLRSVRTILAVENRSKLCRDSWADVRPGTPVTTIECEVTWVGLLLWLNAVSLRERGCERPHDMQC